MASSAAGKNTEERKRRVYRPSAQRREEIISAAQSVFAHSSYAGARTRDIAEAAGVNQAILFKLFPSKEQLFEEAVIQPLEAAFRAMYGTVEEYRKAKSADEMAELAQPSTFRHLENMERIFPLLVSALFSDLESGKRLYAEHIEPLIRQRGSVLEPLVREGVDPEFVGLANFGMMFAVAMQRWLGGCKGDLESVAGQLNRLSTGGFARSQFDEP